MYYLYPVYKSNKKQEINYYYCCVNKPKGDKFKLDKVSQQEINRLIFENNSKDKRLIPGCVIDKDTYEIIRMPELIVSDNLDYVVDKSNVIKFYDCTTIYLYQIDGNWKLGSINSWDISNIREYGKDNSYGKYFEESLQNCEINIDYNNLNKNKVYTIQFVNPNIHLMENNYKVWCFNPDEANFEIPPFIPEKLINESCGYAILEPNRLTVIPTKQYKNLTDLCYRNRRRFLSSTYEIGLVKFILTCLSDNRINDSYVKTQTNYIVKNAYNEINNVIDNFIEEKINSGYSDVVVNEETIIPVKSIVEADIRKKLLFHKNKKFLLEIIDAKLNLGLTEQDVKFTTKYNKNIQSSNKNKKSNNSVSNRTTFKPKPYFVNL